MHLILGLIVFLLFVSYLFGMRGLQAVTSLGMVVAWGGLLVMVVKTGQETGRIAELPMAVAAVVAAGLAAAFGMKHLSRCMVVVIIFGIGYAMLHDQSADAVRVAQAPAWVVQR